MTLPTRAEIEALADRSPLFCRCLASGNEACRFAASPGSSGHWHVSRGLDWLGDWAVVSCRRGGEAEAELREFAGDLEREGRMPVLVETELSGPTLSVHWRKA